MQPGRFRKFTLVHRPPPVPASGNERTTQIDFSAGIAGCHPLLGHYPDCIPSLILGFRRTNPDAYRPADFRRAVASGVVERLGFRTPLTSWLVSGRLRAKTPHCGKRLGSHTPSAAGRFPRAFRARLVKEATARVRQPGWNRHDSRDTQIFPRPKSRRYR